MNLPPLYAIVDRETLDRRGVALRAFAEALCNAGVKLVQYRDKLNGPQEVLRAAAEVRDVFAATGTTLILNDRADLAALAHWDGVHVGQGDLSPADARKVMGARGLVGLSTHNVAQLTAAGAAEADYVAVGPVFATSTKLDAEAVVGLEGVRTARRLTTKPLVAIGGITREHARSVLDAGADAVAVIGGLFADGETVRAVAEDFLRILR